MTYFYKKNLIVTIFLAALVTSCQPAAIAGDSGIGDPYYSGLGNGGYDVQRYVISLDVNPETGLINGKTTIEAVATARLSSFNLDFQGLEVDSVKVNGGMTDYTRNGYELIITPKKSIRSESGFVAEIAYHGEPHAMTSVAHSSMVGWFQGETGTVNVFSEPDGASTWFPANDHPLDKALYRFEITVPKPWIVAATGTLLETTAEGEDTRFVWEMDKPMASYLAGVNIDRYFVDANSGPAGVTIRNYIPEGIDASLTENLRLLPEMLSYFTGLFNPYPFSEFGVLVADETASSCIPPNESALEAQSLSIHCPDPFFFSERVLAHELAHQWFGDSVSLERWQDLWLKEGMATYAEWLWQTRNQDVNALTELANEQRKTYYQDEMIGQQHMAKIYDDESYTGGALVFHALRLRVGDEAFFKILRTYLDRYRYSNAGTDEFIAVAEEISGEELSSFFESWLMQTKLPELPTPSN